MWRDRLTFRDILDNGEALGLALLVHALIAAVLYAGMQWSFERRVPSGTVIQAQVVDVSQMVEQMEQRQQAEQQAAAEAARRERERQAQQERERREAEQRTAEQQRQEQLEQQRREEQARQEELARERERQEQLDALQQQQEEAARQREQAEQRLEAIEERRRQEAAEQQRQAEAARQRQLMEQEAAAQRQQARAGQEAEWIGAVKSVVTRSWIRPPTARPGLSCTVSVRAIPGGEVISANIIEPCNADEATRRSIENAVMSASPLPYRGYEDAFTRSFNFNFTYDG